MKSFPPRARRPFLAAALALFVLTPGAGAKPRWVACKPVRSDRIVVKTGPVHQIGSTCAYAHELVDAYISDIEDARDYRGLRYLYNGRNEDPGVLAACVGRTHRRHGHRFIHVFCRGAGETGPGSGGAWRFNIDSRYYDDYDPSL